MKPFERKRYVLVPVILYHNVGPFRPGTNPALTVGVSFTRGMAGSPAPLKNKLESCRSRRARSAPFRLPTGPLEQHEIHQ